VVAAMAVALLAIIVVVALASGGTSPGGSRSARAAARSGRPGGRRRHRGRGASAGSRLTTHRRGASTAAALGPATGRPGTVSVPILMYHVIAPPPPGAPFPGLYVPASEFAAQMRALKRAGWVGVTLDQLRANWTRGAPLPAGKPIVLTFDNGYHSQYTEALPVLRRMGWPADENIQLSGLPPSQGGLDPGEVRAMVSAGWELDTQGISHADLITLGPDELHAQVFSARRTIQREYGVPVNWFCYPSGHYDATVIAAVRQAGYVGSTTVVPGWASPGEDPYRLPRLRVLGGTAPDQLLAQIASNQSAPAPPTSYGQG
jgi:peptidoglycan/xylan/chitin deacetylase (PgdA/CDA1 family)